jgi:dTMP kinase
MRGSFVTFEGIDGSGKTSVARKTAARLRRRGLPIVLTTEPTKTWLGDAVKRSYREPVSNFTEAFLFMADRATHTTRIEELLRKGTLVISDRYCDSTYAYQAARLKGMVKDPMNWLKRISEPFVIEPDLTILLDIEPRSGLRRIAARKKKVHFENEPFLRQVRRNYLALAGERRFVVLDASRSLDEVVEDSVDVISSRLRVSKGLR